MSELVDIVHNAFRKSLLVGTAATMLFFSGCKKPEPDKPDNSPPVAYADVSPLSGVAPLSSRVKVWGTDVDGLDDIVSYTLDVNGHDSISASPFDFVKVFNVSGVYNVYSVVTDSHGASNKSKVVTVNVSSPAHVSSTCSVNFLSSISGDSPLSLSLKVSGTSGDDPIVGYKLHVDDRVSPVKKSSVDTTLTLYAGSQYNGSQYTGSHIIFGEAVTASGASVTSPSYNVAVNWVDGPDKVWGFPYLVIPLPKSPLNVFASRDNTASALEFSAANNRSQRDALIASRVDASWLSHYPSSDSPRFNCNNYMIGGVIASIASLGTNLYFTEWSNKDFKLFDWYSKTNPDSIRFHGGTFYGDGDLGFPMLEFIIQGTPGNHGMNAVVSGDDLSVESLNKTDFLYDATNIAAGQYNLWENCTATVSYPYSYSTNTSGATKTYLTEVKLMIINYVNGAATSVTYNPNIELVKARNGK